MPTTSATAATICERALKLIGQLAAGESASAEDSADAFEILNGMIDSWSMDRLFVYTMQLPVYALTANQQSYPIGVGAAAPFNVPRPNAIHNANIVITSQTPNVRRRMYVTMDATEWMDISIRPLPTPSIPTEMYYQRDYADTTQRGTLYFWPTPQGGLSVELEVWQQLAQFTAITDAFNFPPGYYEAVYQNLAVRLCTPEWGFDAPPASIVALAQESRRRIEALNMDPPPLMRVDAGLQGTRQAEYRQGDQRFNIKNPAPQWYR